MKNEGKVTNVFLSGVGGQGTILAGSILCEVFMQAGFDVKKAEVHGMAQRGGDVATHFRFGEKVFSPLIKCGEVDYLISFELLEAARYLNWLKPRGRVIINRRRILPPSVSIGQAAYPDDIENIFREHFKDNVLVIDGQDIAAKLGNIQTANVVLVGAFSGFFPDIANGVWIDAVKSFIAPQFHEINTLAFLEGRKVITG
jgi:indolepyruvate ferredoxin oxidoreductase, beta subunit